MYQALIHFLHIIAIVPLLFLPVKGNSNGNFRSSDFFKHTSDTIFIPGDTIEIRDTVYIYTKNNPVRWEIDISSGSFIPVGSYNSSTESQIVTEILNKETGFIPGINTALNFNMYYDFWMIHFGIGYTGIREKVSHKPTNLLIEQVLKTEEVIIDTFYTIGSTGDTSFNYVSVPREILATDSSYLNSPYNNNYSYVQIPVKAGYVWYKNNFLYILKAGVIANIFFTTKKKLISVNNENELYTLNQGNNVRKLNLLYSLDFRIQYNYSGNLAFYLEPNIQILSKSIFNNSFPVENRPLFIGLKAGFNVKL